MSLVNDLLEAPEPLKELVHVVHKLLCSSPALVLRVALQQDYHNCRDIVHTYSTNRNVSSRHIQTCISAALTEVLME